MEVENLAMLQEALEAGADIIMLDNMDNETIKKAVEIVNGRAQIECSGNITKERLRAIAQMEVDFVSVGTLTHCAHPGYFPEEFEALDSKIEWNESLAPFGQKISAFLEVIFTLF